MSEEWRPVIGYESRYEVSSKGKIRSVDREYLRSNGAAKKEKGVARKLRVGSSGYMEATINNNGKLKTARVHRLVAEAFIPNPDGLRTVNHKDGDKLNNDVSNLEWATYSQNNKHAFDSGLKVQPKSMDQSEVAFALALIESGISASSVGRLMNRHVTTVTRNIRYKLRLDYCRHWEKKEVLP